MATPTETAPPIGLMLADPVLAGVLTEAAKAQGFIMLADESLPLQLRQKERTLSLYRGADRIEQFLLPARLGTVLDALHQAGRQLPSLPLAGGLRLDPQARRLDLGGTAAVPLTEKEVEILVTLATQASATNPLPRAALMDTVWGYSPEADTHTLETHVYRLRQKLEGAGVPALLLTGEGGYYLAQD